MTKKYVLLTRGITGLSGNPRYVNFKCKYLKENGWDVVVIWSHNIGNLELEHVKPFANNVIHELQFFPSWFNRFDQNKVVDKMMEIIGSAGKIVIESNKLQLAAWGELLAKKLNVKHVSFITTEGICINNKSSFDFYYAKLKRNEFFCISPSMVRKMFSKYLPEIEAEKYYWSASNGVEVRDVSFPEFDNLPLADYTISHFGRHKSYFPNMIKELGLFVNNHLNKRFNIFFLGDVGNEDDIKNGLNMDNVTLVFSPPLEIIPESFIKKSDIIIGTAGCAHIVQRNGGKVLSMCIDDNEPLGLLGCTTLDSNVRSGKYDNPYSVSKWLEKTLIEGKHFETLADTHVSHSFDYQMQFFTEPDGVYIDSRKVDEKLSAHDKLWSTCMRLGFSKPLVELFFIKNRKHAVR